MSALWAGLDPTGGGKGGESVARPRLRPVPAAPPRLARRPFAAVVIGVFGLGMAGLLMLNTTLQNQTFEARRLDRQATQLGHIQVDLESQLDQAASATTLARRATDLGMRADPKPVFLVLPSGRVVGKPTPVAGDEVPNQVVKTPAERAEETAAAKAERESKQAKKAADRRLRELRAQRQAEEEAERAEREQRAGTADPTTARGD